MPAARLEANKTVPPFRLCNFLTERILAQYSHLEKVNGANVSLYCHLYDVCVVYVVSYLQSLLKVHHFQYHPN